MRTHNKMKLADLLIPESRRALTNDTPSCILKWFSASYHLILLHVERPDAREYRDPAPLTVLPHTGMQWGLLPPSSPCTSQLTQGRSWGKPQVSTHGCVCVIIVLVKPWCLYSQNYLLSASLNSPQYILFLRSFDGAFPFFLAID